MKKLTDKEAVIICPKCESKYYKFKAFKDKMTKHEPYFTLWFKFQNKKIIFKTMEMTNHGKNWYCENCGNTEVVKNA